VTPKAASHALDGDDKKEVVVVRRSIMARAVVLVALTALAGFPAVANASTGSSPLVINVSQGPNSLDPANVCEEYSIGYPASALYVELTQYGAKAGPDGTTQADPKVIEPYLAKSWKISDKGRVYTFDLHPGVKFPSGRPVNAAAVKFSIDRAVKMNLCGANWLLDNQYKPPLIEKTAAPNPTTFVVTLSRPDPNFIQAVAQAGGAIVDPGLINAHGGVVANQANQWMASHDAGSGPYVIASYTPNKDLLLKANPTFFGPPPATREVDINFISSDPTLLLDARSGEADATIGLAPQSISSLKSDPDVHIIATDSPLVEQVVFRTNVKPFNNLKFREALNLAVPYQDLVSKVAFGYASSFSGPLSPALNAYNPALQKPLTQNTAEAKKLIAASGVKLPVSVALTIPEGDAIMQEIATILQSVYSPLGIKMSIQTVSVSDYDNLVFSHKAVAFTYDDGPSLVDAGYYMSYDTVCGGPYNVSELCIPALDKVVNEARVTTNAAKRQALYNRAIEIWKAHWPRITLFGNQMVVVLGQRFEVPTYYGGIWYDFRHWKVR
jgi:peptide/nickel transport system substrate-binding protein